MSDGVFELKVDGKRYRILCQERNDRDFSDVAWSGCPVPQVIRDAINERLGKPLEKEPTE